MNNTNVPLKHRATDIDDILGGDDEYHSDASVEISDTIVSSFNEGVKMPILDNEDIARTLNNNNIAETERDELKKGLFLSSPGIKSESWKQISDIEAHEEYEDEDTETDESLSVTEKHSNDRHHPDESGTPKLPDQTGVTQEENNKILNIDAILGTHEEYDDEDTETEESLSVPVNKANNENPDQPGSSQELDQPMIALEETKKIYDSDEILGAQEDVVNDDNEHDSSTMNAIKFDEVTNESKNSNLEINDLVSNQLEWDNFDTNLNERDVASLKHIDFPKPSVWTPFLAVSIEKMEPNVTENEAIDLEKLVPPEMFDIKFDKDLILSDIEEYDGDEIEPLGLNPGAERIVENGGDAEFPCEIVKIELDNTIKIGAEICLNQDIRESDHFIESEIKSDFENDVQELETETVYGDDFVNLEPKMVDMTNDKEENVFVNLENKMVETTNVKVEQLGNVVNELELENVLVNFEPHMVNTTNDQPRDNIFSEGAILNDDVITEIVVTDIPKGNMKHDVDLNLTMRLDLKNRDGIFAVRMDKDWSIIDKYDVNSPYFELGKIENVFFPNGRQKERFFIDVDVFFSEEDLNKSDICFRLNRKKDKANKIAMEEVNTDDIVKEEVKELRFEMEKGLCDDGTEEMDPSNNNNNHPVVNVSTDSNGNKFYYKYQNPLSDIKDGRGEEVQTKRFDFRYQLPKFEFASLIKTPPNTATIEGENKRFDFRYQLPKFEFSFRDTTKKLDQNDVAESSPDDKISSPNDEFKRDLRRDGSLNSEKRFDFRYQLPKFEFSSITFKPTANETDSTKKIDFQFENDEQNDSDICFTIPDLPIPTFGANNRYDFRYQLPKFEFLSSRNDDQPLDKITSPKLEPKLFSAPINDLPDTVPVIELFDINHPTLIHGINSPKNDVHSFNDLVFEALISEENYYSDHSDIDLFPSVTRIVKLPHFSPRVSLRRRRRSDTSSTDSETRRQDFNSMPNLSNNNSTPYNSSKFQYNSMPPSLKINNVKCPTNSEHCDLLINKPICFTGHHHLNEKDNNFSIIFEDKGNEINRFEVMVFDGTLKCCEYYLGTCQKEIIRKIAYICPDKDFRLIIVPESYNILMILLNAEMVIEYHLLNRIEALKRRQINGAMDIYEVKL